MRFEILLDRYFSNFPRLLLTNLIFFVPLFVISALLYFISGSTLDGINIMMLPVVIFFVFPFYPGVVLVCRDIARGYEKVKVFQTFIRGIKENFFRFLLYGFVLSLAFIISYYSVSFYSKLLSNSWVYYVVLFLCVLIVLAVLYTFFYVPLMTVTFDLSIKHIIKNSFLMSFGEIKNNFFATVWLLVVIALGFTLTLFSKTMFSLILTLALLFALFLPASCQYVISFYIFDNMYSVINNRDEVLSGIDKALKNPDNKNKATASNTEDFSDIDVSKLVDNDDYIYYNGRMVKQSYILKKLKEQDDNKDKEV